jgi:hypothetical protein
MIKSYREKTAAYSIRGSKFVNAFDHLCVVGQDTIRRKTVDSSSVSEKPRLWRSLAGYQCGKTEEDFGKKGSFPATVFKQENRNPSSTNAIFFDGRSDNPSKESIRGFSALSRLRRSEAH